MKIPGFAKRPLSRRSRKGWLVRISARLADADLARLSGEADAVRTALADRVMKAARPGDGRTVLTRNQYLMVIRVGQRSTDASDPIPVVRRLLDSLAAPVESSLGPIFPRLNAAFTITACDAEDTEARAALTEALEQAERAGSGVALALDPVNGTSEMLTLETAEMETVGILKRAVDAGQVILHYQPVVRLSDGRMTSVEALMRVVDENGGGLLFPGQFIESAEKTGLIHELGRIALHVAAAQMKTWRETLGDACPARIAVNVAAPQLANADFVADARAAFAEVGLSALTLELTETAMIREMPEAQQSLAALRAGGAWVALDDFGVEYSNLSYLRDLVVDVVKIDRSFLDGTGSNARGAVIVAKIVELAHQLDARVVAEGIASAKQAEALAQLGVDYGQGEHFGLAMPGQAITGRE
jgi:EAL domain-containing protein (putative c-di-GMP-specific phosphodiesterase class I)